MCQLGGSSLSHKVVGEAEWMAENGYTPSLSSLGLPDQFVTQGTPAQLKHLAGIDSEAILSKIKEVTSDKDNAV